MLNAFEIKNNKLSIIDNNIGKLNKSIWIDLIEPISYERELIKKELGQNFSENLELEKIEFSNKFFENENEINIRSFFFFTDIENNSNNTIVFFSIREGRLYTLRSSELQAFKIYIMQIQKQKIINENAYEILLNLFETKIEQIADEIENIYSALETLSLVIMEGHQENEYNNAFSKISALEDISWKIRLCLMDTQRILNFLKKKNRIPLQNLYQVKEILKYIKLLLPHNESIFNKINFLIQSAMGFINIEQNRIIKIFSVVSVIFLPPTLVASSYGMNFHFMPELNWYFGYPIAIGLMILAGFAPYIYFKKKKWL